ncbi:2-dehydro-3-deoxy-6-phosphogalactonate aldolase [Microbulbifer thermotolerans]|uniref:2-dehydro-3-deoxy-6-phosphogalactonate aldolase n=1 Tax=Microbulbifer thermotolerans TaxID=252514 RepID=UPI002248C4A0|nr:2-dehydro-3-deoxy-6-phosphogalactonate aldolase [Microbulbifer thermotolerans]MCX2780492.1 2-dehydro-3-deoxy-6-phosphogalactonate aldolase [Microbulbifer thermotolerans]MCX2794860.1 2-dehydro-3-deoxy-6-phosphogalactonate aldolase [Microbulbifer thermotolerans]MCX2806028.1 2-dehydro-3-deoxy-6-phosphogalactonate aldolase [Microbulbifer thermotolerans]MCX2842414.1 2-dehydro-3-deoxy-6-phosphogalactonate aldolase [Microbulbifer thermotolerans]WKT59374.1 2-dehydro-3-deoxy-6-phosphogalactonate ald
MRNQRFHQALEACPLIAIIRGVTPDEIDIVANTLLEAGVRAIEVPLNSPVEPLRSIERLAKIMDGYDAPTICGAGTVLAPEQVESVQNAGGEIIVSPNCDPEVISETLSRGLVSVPGCLTPTEAFRALKAGAKVLKMFPVADFPPQYLESLGAVVPKEILTLAVGGITDANMETYWKAGARGFGLGSNIYAAGDSASQVADKARIMVEAARRVRALGD